MSERDNQDRLAGLEAEVRRLRRWVAGLLLAAVAGASIALARPAGPGPVEASSLVIRDAGGKARLSIGTEDEFVFVDLMSRGGKRMARFAAEDDQDPHLAFFKTDIEDPLLKIGVRPTSYNPWPYVEMTGPKQAGLKVEVGGENGPSFSMTDPAGADKLMLGLTERERHPFLQLMGGDAPNFVHVEYAKGGRVAFKNRKGDVTYRLPPPGE